MQVCTLLQTDIHAKKEEGIAAETEGDRYPPHLRSPKNLSHGYTYDRTTE